MNLPFFRSHLPTLEELEEKRAQRARGINGMIKVTGIIILVMVAIITSMLLLSPVLELHRLEQERERAYQKLKQAKNNETEAYNKLTWMSDTEYFENMIRDVFNMAKEGETVIRRPVSEHEQQTEKEASSKKQPKKKALRD